MLICHKRLRVLLELRKVAKALGVIIRELRTAAGLPRSEVARRAKIDPSQLWRLENPKDGAQPSFELVRRVAHAVGASLDQIALAVERPRAQTEPSAKKQLDRIIEAVEALRRDLPASGRRGVKSRTTDG